MKAYPIAKKRERVPGSPNNKWGNSIRGDLADRQRGATRKQPVPAADMFPPFGPSTDPDMDRPRRETIPDAPRVASQRRALLALRAQLHGEVTETADSALSGCGIESTCSSPDTADRAGEIIEQDTALGLLGNATGRLEQIESALESIADGSYGRCVECDARIPAARLEAVPYATRCVRCAARLERRA